MSDLVLGTLPAYLAHLARFRPADPLDFSRRAKHLAHLLQIPLQETQNILARAYGYAHLHELQEVLKAEGSPGPYQDRLVDHLSAIEPKEADAHVQLDFYRQQRLMRLISDRFDQTPREFLENRHMLACDLGLFCTPGAHRLAKKAVDAFIESGKGVTDQGFPFGYNGHLHAKYYSHFELETDAFAAIGPAFEALGATPEHFHPDQQLRLTREFRAPELFLAMIELASPPKPSIATCFDDCWDGFEDSDSDRLLLSRFTNHISYCLASQYAGDSDDFVDDETWSCLQRAVDEPSDEHIATSSVARSIPNFRAEVLAMRTSLRTDLASAYRAGEIDDVPRRPRMLFRGGRDDRVLSVLMEQRDDGELSITCWDVAATLLLRDDTTGSYRAAAVLAGQCVDPLGEDGYSPPEEVIEFFDWGSGELHRVWTLLTTTYFARAGYESYDEFVNDDMGSVVANLAPWVAPQYRGTEVLHWLYRDFVDVFSESSAYPDDAFWRGWITLDVDEGDDDVFESAQDSCFYRSINPVYVPLPKSGVLAMSVWDGDDDHATGQLLREDGRRARRSRMMRGLQKEERKGIAWRFLKAVKEIEADFVLYDPLANGPAQDE
jgi:hypothetical protein